MNELKTPIAITRKADVLYLLLTNDFFTHKLAEEVGITGADDIVSQLRNKNKVDIALKLATEKNIWNRTIDRNSWFLIDREHALQVYNKINVRKDDYTFVSKAIKKDIIHYFTTNHNNETEDIMKALNVTRKKVDITITDYLADLTIGFK